jgi:hypothetical protein
MNLALIHTGNHPFQGSTSRIGSPISKPTEGLVLQIQPINLTAIIAVIMGISVVLVPVLGLTARYALKPIVEALGRVFEGRGKDERVQILERRVGLLETHIENLESTFHRLEEGTTFDRQLRSSSEPEPDRLPKS